MLSPWVTIMWAWCERQAAPFSKGKWQTEAKSLGRASRARPTAATVTGRPQPATPERELEAALPERCGACGGMVVRERVDEQWQVEIPPITPVVTKGPDEYYPRGVGCSGVVCGCGGERRGLGRFLNRPGSCGGCC